MSTVVLDDATVEKLVAAGPVVEVRDEAGKLHGYLEIDPGYRRTAPAGEPDQPTIVIDPR